MTDESIRTASQIATAIRAHEVTAVQVLEDLISRVEKYNPALNAIVTLDIDRARRQAQEADEALSQDQIWGPLHGVPITIKDSFETVGLRTVSGYPPFAQRVPNEDAPPVARLRQAGAIILGKTNLPTLASGIQSNNPVFGRTNNPWDLESHTGRQFGRGRGGRLGGNLLSGLGQRHWRIDSHPGAFLRRLWPEGHWWTH